MKGDSWRAAGALVEDPLSQASLCITLPSSGAQADREIPEG